MTDWTQALCLHADPDAWYPEPGANGTIAAVKATCRRCPLLYPCQQWALTHDDEAGVWGALGESDRRSIRAGRTTPEAVMAADEQREADRDEVARQRAKQRAGDGLKPHGTHSAFRRHEDRGEDACDLCKQGERVYQRERKRGHAKARRSA